MNCSNCNKEEETIQVAGQIYCANCGTLLSGKSQSLKVKVPKIEPTHSEIRTDHPEPTHIEENKDIKDMADRADIPAKSADELGASGILLDILSDEALQQANDSRIRKDEDLITASSKTIDALASAPIPRKIQDISAPRKDKNQDDYLHSLFNNTAHEVQKIKDKESKSIKKNLGNEKGYTKLKVDYLLTFATSIIAAFLLWALLKLTLF